MAIQDELVEVGGLLGGELVQAKVVEDAQIRGQERGKSPHHEVALPCQIQGTGEIFGVDEAHVVTGADGGVAQDLGEGKLFPKPAGPRKSTCSRLAGQDWVAGNSPIFSHG